MKRNRQRVTIHDGTADLWAVETSDANDGAVRAVQAADDLDAELAPIRAEFATADADIDEASAIIHAKAITVLAASRRPLDEASYLACLNAVASAPSTGRGSDPDLERHLESAAALADLARIKLRERGLTPNTDGYDDAFVAEVTSCARSLGVDYYHPRGA